MSAQPVIIRQLHASDADFHAHLMSVLAFEAGEDDAIDRAVAGILSEVKTRGDAAVLDYTNKFDRLTASSMDALEIPHAELQAALHSLTPARMRLGWFYLYRAGWHVTGPKSHTTR